MTFLFLLLPFFFELAVLSLRGKNEDKKKQENASVQSVNGEDLFCFVSKHKHASMKKHAHTHAYQHTKHKHERMMKKIV